MTGGFLEDLGGGRRRDRVPRREDAERLPVVPFVPFRCPRCDALHPQTYGQRGATRYHRCRSCGGEFRSREIPPGDLGNLPGFCSAEIDP